MVGRLAMRHRLCSEGLLPKDSFTDYLEQINAWDEKVVRSLAAGSQEYRIAEEFRKLNKHNQGPFGNDQQKPENLLLRSEDMAISTLSPSRLCLYLRHIAGSLRGLFQRNGDFPPYSILKKAGGFLLLVQIISWLFEKTIFYRPRTSAGSYVYVLLLGLILGFIIGIILI
jgi:hypothetical protein